MTRLMSFGWLVAMALFSPANAQEKPASKNREAAFVVKNVEGWTVHVSRGALDDHKRETEQALDHMANQLFQIKLVLPAKSLAKLQRVPIWLANGEQKLGIAFHPSRNWLTGRGYRPPKPRSLIGIVSGKHYLHESLRQPWLVFHELSHGYDWYILGETRTYGSDSRAFQNGIKKGKYAQALHWNGRMRKPYHATNKMEFFAETSEAFFGTNDIFPFVRAELRDHDLEAFHNVAAQWNVDLAGQRRDEKDLADLLRRQPLIPADNDSAKRAPRNKSAAFTPTTKYKRHQIEGWTVLVAPELSSKKSLAARTLRLLRRDLHYIKRYVPASAIGALQTARIWVEDADRHVIYATYHASSARLRRQGGNPDKVHGIEIGNAANYLRWFPLQPSLLLHLSAGHFYETALGKSRRDVTAALLAARRSPQYKSVLRFDGRRVRHPGLHSERDFFTEFSESFYGTNDHFPFVRAELRKHDPATAALMERLWKIRPQRN